MESLSDLLEQYHHRLDHIPEEVRFIPDDGVCKECTLLLRNHPGVNKVLAARQLQYIDPDTGLLTIAEPIPYCRCDYDVQSLAADRMSKELKRELDSNLPQSVKGAGPRMFLDGTLENFEDRAGTEEAFAIAADYTVGNAPPVLILIGGTGTGKTHLMEAIGRQYLSQGNTVRYELASHLLERARDAIRNSTAESVLAPCYKADLLLLDDVGLEKPRAWVSEQLGALIDERYRNKRLLVIGTNELYPSIEASLGGRLASRIFDDATGTVTQVYLNAPDYRRQVADAV